MSEEDGDSRSRRHHLLSRSRWIKPKSGGKGEQDKDVVDFLKPSTDKAAAMLPKINVAVAQRFPSAQGLPPQDITASYRPSSREDVNGLRRKRRREGLKVAFVDTKPEIIGEGGDEAPYPPCEYGRRRSRQVTGGMLAADSARKTLMYDRRVPAISISTSAGAEREFEPSTSFSQAETNARTPEHVAAYGHNTLEHKYGGLPPSIPPRALDAAFAGELPQRRLTLSPAVSEKGRAMRVNEGMALRRGSAFIDDYDDDEHENENDDNDPPPHFLPHSNTLGSTFKAPAFPRDAALRRPQHFRSRSSEIRPSRRVPDEQVDKAMHSSSREPQSAAGSFSNNGSPVTTPAQGAYPGQTKYRAYRPDVSEHAHRAIDAAGGAASEQRTNSFDIDTRPRLSRPISLGPPSPASRSIDSTGQQQGQQPPGEAAFADFSARVAHMKGVFSLTAERERPSESCAAEAWLRTACWWFIEGKIELEQALRHRARLPDPHSREKLLQGHVDLAKAWWILTDRLEHVRRQQESDLLADCAVLRDHLQALCLSIGRSRIMPPHASLIQGQDTRIWLEDPSLGGSAATPFGAPSSNRSPGSIRMRLSPVQALPLGDTAQMFCYNHCRVHVAVGSIDSDSAHQSLPCIASVVRDARTFQNSVIIASQDYALSMVIGSSSGAIDWQDIKWHIKGNVLSYQPDRNTFVSVYLRENDFRLLRSMIDYTHKAIDMLRAETGELPTFKCQVLSAKYSDSAGTRIFPKDPVRDCQVCIFEQTVAGRARRLAIATSPSTKILSCVSHQLHTQVVLSFESLARQDGSSVPALRFSLQDDGRRADVQLEFADMRSMHEFCAAAAGCSPGPGEAIGCDVAIASLAVELTPQSNLAQVKPDVLKLLDWQAARLITSPSPVAGKRGIITRLSLHFVGGWLFDTSCNELEPLIRLHAGKQFSLQMLSPPQPDVAASVDRRLIYPGLQDAFVQLVHDMQSQATIRTFTFKSQADLHRFQEMITGLEVLYEGAPSSFIVTRRKLGVPKKYPAAHARLQLLKKPQEPLHMVVAFVDDFELGTVICFEVKSTDTFEQIKGDGKSKKWSIKLDDTKFSSNRAASEQDDESSRVLREQFVIMTNMRPSDEHGDITVGFDNEADRDRFAKALPATTKGPRSMNILKRG